MVDFKRLILPVVAEQPPLLRNQLAFSVDHSIPAFQIAARRSANAQNLMSKHDQNKEMNTYPKSGFIL